VLTKTILSFSAISILAMGIQAPGIVDDSNVRPPVTKADIEIVKRAREFLNSPAKWNRADTRECPANEKTFSLYCALEKATEGVSAHFEHRGAAMQQARFVIDDIAPNRNYDHRLMGYNNDPTTTFADIQRVFTLLETRIANRLRDEPGGQPAQAPQAPKSELEILKQVRTMLDSEAKWNRASTQDCPADSPTIGLYCAFERASIEVTGKFDDDGFAIQETRRVISETAPNRKKYQARLVDYNNDPTVSLADLQKLLQVVQDRLTKSLAKQ
jgi:hypothetical protein